MPVAVSIIIPVFNKLAFTRQCLDRIARHASGQNPHEVIVVDNGSTDGTQRFFEDLCRDRSDVVYVRHAANLGFSAGNNAGARLSNAKYLLFLNNDTLVQEGWLDAMVRVAEADARVGVVGIKQLFPYTNTIHHTGIIFSADRTPQHIYPHANASLSYVNKEREYQAVTGSCLLIGRQLFLDCGLFDAGYRNGYEDIDLCLKVRERQRRVVCCTSAFIYHYGQITDTRAADDDMNLARFRERWGRRAQPDELAYFQQDRAEIARADEATPSSVQGRPDLIYFADDLSTASALTWVTVELVLALQQLGAAVAIRQGTLPASTTRTQRTALERLMLREPPVGGVHIRWSHYWPQHLGMDLNGRINLELFVINYLFDRPGSQPWDYWLQCLPQNRYHKLALSGFCRDVLLQVGVSASDCHLLQPGYSPEIERVAPRLPRRSKTFRLLTVTNSHDLERYGTIKLLEAYWQAFSTADDVVLVLKDYGAASGDATLKKLLRANAGRAAVEFISQFTSKEELIALYRSCDAFVSAHRGEGYGMKILDAMACGLPVITPLFGGPGDFCAPGNCFPVDFTLVPVGDCLDTRSLQITNAPVWAEPDMDSLVRQMQAVARDRDAATQVGQRARRDVTERFSWENTARQLLAAVASIDASGPRRIAEAPSAPPAERSAYWMGTRISVVVPTYNRKASLLKCLRTLERQSILPHEFEAIVVDDGSTDGTNDMLATETFAFPVKYIRQANKGPGTARNEGVRQATGEMILFIGDDIMADERLLESHLTAHATWPEPGVAVLGHIDWVPGIRRSALMDFVCGESSLQFAYAFIPKLEKLDYRFFYTSNISLKRSFLLDAAADGVAFDPHFRYAAFEDSELAFRLAKRGLDIRYASQALAYHDHYMDLAGFSRREYLTGQMAVVFYRKHPQIDEQLQVRWIGDWVDAVDTLATKPDLHARLRALDVETDTFLRSLAGTLEDLIGVQSEVKTGGVPPKLESDSLARLLHGVLGIILEIERARGKVEEWYGAVRNRETVDTARQLVGCMRKLEFLSAHPSEMEKLRGTVAWLAHDVVGGLRAQIEDLERQLVGRRNGHARARSLKRGLWQAARKTDLLIQQQLGERAPSGWLDQYEAVRQTLKRLLVPPR